MVNINIPIPDDLHRRMKLRCVMEGISIKEFIIRTLSRSVDGKTRRGRRGG